jgi:uracil-DNA glycosylase family 4
MIDPSRQLRIRLQSLAVAGVDWVPVGTPLPKVDRTNFAARPAESLATEPTTPIVPADERKVALATLAKEVAGCAKCPELFSTRIQTVFGVGPLSPELCFVGEAPGFDEDQQGEPFVGAAGQMLTKIITGCGFKREDVYICNTLKCRPPGNATPTTKQCDNCRPFFERQIDLIQPKMICCLGGTAAKNLLQTSLGVYKLRGKIHQYRGIPVVVTVHPSYIIRQAGDALQKSKADCWEDMKLVLKELGRPLPGKSSQ